MDRKDINDELRYYQKLFERAYQANTNNDNRDYKKSCEEFYYNDVEHNKSEFTNKQKEAIKRTYNIPVSSKLAYSIVESMLSFITATKPFARLIAVDDNHQEFVFRYQKAYHAVWYENQVNNEITKALKDMLNVGDGYILVDRTNDRMITTNVEVRYIPWRHIFIDPDCTRDNLQDAEYIFYVDMIRQKKAKELYGVDIKSSELITGDEWGISYEELEKELLPIDLPSKYKDLYILRKILYLKKYRKVYIDPDGNISIYKPKEIQVPNPVKLQMKEKLKELQAQIDNLSQIMVDSTQRVTDIEIPANNEEADVYNQSQENALNAEQTMNQLAETIKQLKSEIRKQPNEITKYKFVPLDYEDADNKIEKEIDTYEIKEINLIEKIVIINNEIVHREVVPGDMFPIINFTYNWFNSPNRVYGIIHYIQDIIKAYNKSIAEALYALSLNGHRKVIMWETTVIEPKQIEQNWAKPSGVTILRPDPMLSDGGKPIIFEPAPINQSIQYLLEHYKMLVEYITGIYGIMQGNPNDAPNTYGSTQALQNFGSQRIKLVTRSIEHAFERLAYVIVNYIKAYTDKNKKIKYFNIDNEQEDVTLVDIDEDIQFKVRIEIINSLPTTRQMMAQLLGFIAQTAGDPMLTKLLTGKMLEIADVPEGKEMKQQLDVIEQMQQQIQQLTMQNEQLTKELDKVNKQRAKEQLDSSIQLETEKAKQDIIEEKTKQEYEPVEEFNFESDQQNVIPF